MMFSRTLLYLSALISVLSVTLGAEGKFCGYPFKRLPNWYRPAHYEVKLSLHSLHNTHSGEVSIIINSHGPSSNRRNLILHAAPNLKINSLRLFRLESDSVLELNKANPIPVKIKDICQDETYQLLVVELDESELDKKPDVFNAIISFDGVTTTNGQGIVRVNYGDELATHEGRRILYSKFDRSNARFVMPCFDEARFRSSFRLHVQNLATAENVFSNTFCNHFTFGGEDVPVRNYEFNLTQPLSVHQFGFVIAKTDFAKPKLERGMANVKLIQLMAFQKPAELTRTLLNGAMSELANYFKLKNPNKIIDIVAYPGIGRALETQMAGVIVADSNRILYHELLDAEQHTLLVASVIDMLARQWIGYMVTQKNDEDRWFFEGLVGWICLRLTDRMRPRLNYRMLYSAKLLSRAMREDAQPNAVPLLRVSSVPGSNSQIPTVLHQSPAFSGEQTSNQQEIISRDFILDETARIKATSIIVYYEDSCGYSKFDVVISRLMMRYQYDLVNIMEFSSIIKQECKWNSDLSLDFFTMVPGYPLVKASQTLSNQLVLAQQRFLSDFTRNDQQNLGMIQSSGERIIIPVVFKYGDFLSDWIREFYFRMLNNQSATKINLPSGFHVTNPGSWIKVNTGIRSFYRVLYSDQMLLAILAVGKLPNILTDLDRFCILDDALEIFKSGKVGAYYLVETLKAMAHNQNEYIQLASVTAFQELKKLYAKIGQLDASISGLGVQLFGNVFMEHEFSLANLITDEGKTARQQIYESLAKLDFKPLIKASLRIYQSPNLYTVNQRLHEAIFIAVARHGTDFQYTEMMALLKSQGVSATPDLDRKIVNALAFSTEIPKLTLAWNHVQTMNPDLIEQFILAVLESNIGQNFAISNIVADLPELFYVIGARRTTNVMTKICVTLGEATKMCSPNSPMKGLLGHLNWNNLITSVLEMRHGHFYRQRLDLNKLVIS